MSREVLFRDKGAGPFVLEEDDSHVTFAERIGGDESWLRLQPLVDGDEGASDGTAEERTGIRPHSVDTATAAAESE